MNPPRNILGLKRPNSIMDISNIEAKINDIENEITSIKNKIIEIEKKLKESPSNERLQERLIEKEKQLTIATTERLHEKEKLLRAEKEQKLAYEIGKYYSNQQVLFVTAVIVINSC